MAVDGLLAGSDEGFEAGLTVIGAGVMLGDGVLTDGLPPGRRPQVVKPRKSKPT